MGSDNKGEKERKDAEKFQFALPHGERPHRISRSSLGRMFQFALPHGERHKTDRLTGDVLPFQFALPHGERLPSCNDRYSLHRKRTIR